MGLWSSVGRNRATDEGVLEAVRRVDGTGSLINADYLDGKSAEYFSVSDHSHSGVYLPISGKAADSDKLNGQLASYYAVSTHHHDSAYLGIGAKAADSILLDGHSSTFFAVAGHDHSGVYLPAGGTAANASALGGYGLCSTAVNNEASKIVRTDSNGYVYFGWVNTVSGDTTSALSRVFVDTGDGFIRKCTVAHLVTSLGTVADSAKLNGQSASYYATATNPAIVGYIDMVEMASPSNPSADHLRFYAEDVSGSTRLRVKFSTGDVSGVVLSGVENSFTKTQGFALVDNGLSGAAKTVNWTSGNKQKITLSGNCVFTFTPPSSPTNLVFMLVQDATGSRTVAWPSGVKWMGGEVPTLTTAAASVDIVAFFYDGTNYFGTFAGAFA